MLRAATKLIVDDLLRRALLADCKNTPATTEAYQLRLKLLREMPETEEIQVSRAINKVLVLGVLPTLSEQAALRKFNKTVRSKYRKAREGG